MDNTEDERLRAVLVERRDADSIASSLTRIADAQEALVRSQSKIQKPKSIWEQYKNYGLR